MNETHAVAAPQTQVTVEGTVVDKGLEKLLLALPGTDYKLQLVLATGVSDLLPDAGSPKRITGTIYAQARRIDIIPKGGRFVEPVQGRPRRVQGRVLAINPTPESQGHIAIQCAPGCVMLVKPLSPQSSTSFKEGQLVSFDVEPGSRFVPIHD